MRESPHVTTSRTLSEPEFPSDVLRIIAVPGHKLTNDDCEYMRLAADQLEAMFRKFAVIGTDLAETHQQNQALTDALREARKYLLTPFSSMGGQFTVTLRQ